jgi:hypothetical protein
VLKDSHAASQVEGWISRQCNVYVNINIIYDEAHFTFIGLLNQCKWNICFHQFREFLCFRVGIFSKLCTFLFLKTYTKVQCTTIKLWYIQQGLPGKLSMWPLQSWHKMFRFTCPAITNDTSSKIRKWVNTDQLFVHLIPSVTSATPAKRMCCRTVMCELQINLPSFVSWYKSVKI